MYRADVENPANDEKSFTLELQKLPLNNILVTTRDFKHPKYRNSTELSKHTSKLKDANISPIIE